LANPKSNARLRVYAVWFNMYPNDARQRWPATLLTDSRVRHYWDGQREVGRLYLQLLPAIWGRRAAETVLPQADALWDAFLLYAYDAEWAEQPPAVVSWGSPILLTSDALADVLRR
jgi:hypothetical protein